MTDHDKHPLLAAALAAASRGWCVFPLHPNSKIPAIRAWQHRATTNTNRIRHCWNSAPFNIGIACGPSRLVVVDLDIAKPGQPIPEQWATTSVRCGADILADIARHEQAPNLWDTFTVTTASGGRHLYYQRPDGVVLGNSVHKIGWLIDTRATGGYVLAPGSTVGDTTYTVTDNHTPIVLPSCLAIRLAQTDRTESSPPVSAFPQALSTATRRDRYITAALRNETKRVGTAPEGQRNHTLYIAALRLGELTATGHLDHKLAVTALTHAALAAGLTPHETHNTIHSGLHTGAHAPRTLPA